MGLGSAPSLSKIWFFRRSRPLGAPGNRPEEIRLIALEQTLCAVDAQVISVREEGAPFVVGPAPDRIAEHVDRIEHANFGETGCDVVQGRHRAPAPVVHVRAVHGAEARVDPAADGPGKALGSGMFELGHRSNNQDPSGAPGLGLFDEAPDAERQGPPDTGRHRFFLKATATQIEVLGGNQSNGVTIARYPRSRLLGIRRAVGVGSSAKPSLRVVQQKLKDLGYHEVGAIDGLFGPRTRAAILAFKADNGLPLTPDIDVAFTTALEKAPPRAIAPERAKGKPQASRIVSAANAQIATGIAGTITIAGAAVAPAIEAAEQAKDMTERAIGLLNLTEFVAPFLPWIGLAIFAVVIALAWRARTARIEDYRTGRTP